MTLHRTMSAALTLLAITLSANAQTSSKSAPALHPIVSAAARPTPPTGSGLSAQLPVTSVSLYKNGVGFFQHSGRVIGDQSVTIDFTSDQLNDVLQSLTAIDLQGGRISGAGYNSTTPLDQQLKSLSLGLDDDPSALDFYKAIRGARIEVTGSGSSISGRLLSLELHEASTEDSGKKSTEKRTLTVVSDSGTVRSIDLTPSVKVRLLDSTLHTDVNRYLELLDTNRNQGLRHLNLRDIGTGARDLQVSYISQVPIWKSTYRILFSDDAKSPTGAATLQGWSVVDNTTGSDWNNVQLTLVAGAPQSFIQPLSTPYYSRRPEIPLPQEAQLTPQTHESGDFAAAPKPVSAGVAGMYGMGSGNGGGIAGSLMGGGGGRARSAVAAAAAPVLASDSATFNATDDENASATVITGRSFSQNYDLLAANSIAPNTTTNAFDDFFEYKLAQPITIRKNESALVPILQTKIDAERVTLWSAQHPVALRALWITNTSNLTLDRGSFSIVESGSFGGEGLLDPIHPKERRLLSYAADQAVRVTTSRRSPSSRITRFVIADGWLRQVSVDSRSVEYTVHDAAAEPRTVVIEHPITDGWALDSTSVKPTETTPTINRYTAVAQPGDKAVIHIDESHAHDQNWRLVETNDAQFNIILHNAAPSPALLAALQPIIDAKHAVAGIDKQITDKQAAINSLVGDQSRLRDNLSALKSTEEERTLARRYTAELNVQEDQLATLRKDLDTLQQQRATAQQDLNNKISNAKIDETL